MAASVGPNTHVVARILRVLRSFAQHCFKCTIMMLKTTQSREQHTHGSRADPSTGALQGCAASPEQESRTRHSIESRSTQCCQTVEKRRQERHGERKTRTQTKRTQTNDEESHGHNGTHVSSCSLLPHATSRLLSRYKALTNRLDGRCAEGHLAPWGVHFRWLEVDGSELRAYDLAASTNVARQQKLR